MNIPFPGDGETIDGLLRREAEVRPDFPYCRFHGETVTLGALEARVGRLAGAFQRLGLEAGERVAVMLGNHPHYITTFFALVRLGVCQVPLNIHLRGDGLAYQVRHTAPSAIVADWQVRDQILPALGDLRPRQVIWLGRPTEAPRADGHDLEDLLAADGPAPDRRPARADDVLLIMFTSGTTGPAKGVMLTDRMLRVAGWAAALSSDARPDDVLFLWEPLYHIGGCQVQITALLEHATIALVERFSASNFWRQVRETGSTQIHFFGGILAILLKEPASDRDRDHRARVAWGANCPPPIWRAFQARFGTHMREAYGMTEASSFTSINTDEKMGSVGRPLPCFEVRLVDDAGQDVATGQTGEIWVRGREPGLITPGYFRNPEATAAALKDGWLRTGDLGSFDGEGFLYYAGRRKDSFRRRGENISAFEVERVFQEHPDVAECAVIGVDNDIGDQDVKLIVRLVDGRLPDPAAIVRWSLPRLARFQVPRYVAFIDEFPKTPTHRIRKELLPKTTADCWDGAAAGR
jgi:crotonobetaine/carnitine-CoA ligase